MLAESIGEPKDTQRNLPYPSSRQASSAYRASAAHRRAIFSCHSGPESIRESPLLYLYHRSGLVGFAAMRTAQAAPPHPVDESQGDIAHQKDNGVSVDDEDEVVEVDHLSGVPRASPSLLWRAVWRELEAHMLYEPTRSINLPRQNVGKISIGISSGLQNVDMN